MFGLIREAVLGEEVLDLAGHFDVGVALGKSIGQQSMHT